MAITFLQEKKKQRSLVLVLALVVACILLIVWWGFFRGDGGVPSVSVVSLLVPKEVSIDWELLQNPEIDELTVFGEISPISGEIGRTNPFTPAQ